jgi:hypothetical protein
LKLFNHSNSQLKEGFGFLYHVAKEKFQFQKKKSINYSDMDYNNNFEKHAGKTRLDDLNQSIDDFKKEYF